MSSSDKRKIGNEVISGRSNFLDLRTMKMVKPATETIRRATTPPIKVELNPVRVTIVPKTSFLDGFAYELLFIMIAAMVSSFTGYRDWVFLAYLVMALVLRVSSQRIFRSALFCLVLVPLLLQFHKDGLADMFAIFTFYFLSIGVVRAIIELRGVKE